MGITGEVNQIFSKDDPNYRIELDRVERLLQQAESSKLDTVSIERQITALKSRPEESEKLLIKRAKNITAKSDSNYKTVLEQLKKTYDILGESSDEELKNAMKKMQELEE